MHRRHFLSALGGGLALGSRVDAPARVDSHAARGRAAGAPAVRDRAGRHTDAL